MKLPNGQRENWSSNLGFILAAAGSAVGLGNIWKFPYIAGENGGGAFVLVYLICIAIIGLPVMLCEITLGRKTQRNPVGALRVLSPSSSNVAHLLGGAMVLGAIFLLGFQRYGWGVLALALGIAIFRYSWTVVGAMGVIAGFVILSFYSVVAGWTLGYVIKSALRLIDASSVEAATDHFVAFAGSPGWSISCHFAFMVMCVAIVIKGVKSGIERWSRILMPMLLLLLIVLIIRGITLENGTAGVRFLLSPDFSKLTTEAVLIALGHAFFTLSLGMGAMITYGSYMKKDQNIFTSSLAITFLDTLIAIMAGLAIFPAVFAEGFEPTKGAGLVFLVLPAVFSKIPLGTLWATLFFLLLMVAALTSGISLLEVVTAYFVDERKWSRTRATLIFGGVIFLIGIPCALSPDKDIVGWTRLPWLQNILANAFDIKLGCFLDVMDTAASNWLLPLGGLFIALFVGWIWGTRKAVEEIREGSHNFADVHLWSLLAGLRDDASHNSDVHVITLASLWGIFIRFVSPVAVMIAFLNTIGWLDFGAEKHAPPPSPSVEQVDGVVAAQE